MCDLENTHMPNHPTVQRQGLSLRPDCSSFRKESGQTLVEVMISIGIMGILILAFASVMTLQVRETRALSEKLASLDFQQQLTRSFADGALCTQLVNGKTFDSSASNPAITLTNNSIPISSSPAAPALATIGQPLSSLSRTLIAGPLPFVIANIVGSVSGGNGTFTGFLQVSFDETQLVRALKPAQTQITLMTTSSGTTQTITGCRGTSGDNFGGMFQVFLCSGFTYYAAGTGCRSPNPYAGGCACPVGYTQYRVNDWDSPPGSSCPKDRYGDGLGNSGMIQYMCYK